MKLGITGTQTGFTEDQFSWFTFYLSDHDVDEFHHGDCVGVDAEAATYVYTSCRAEVISHPPNNDYKRAFTDADVVNDAKPFIERNHNIVDSCDVMLAFPEGLERLRSGTWATIRYAKKQKKPLWIIYQNGKSENFNLENQTNA